MSAPSVAPRPRAWIVALGAQVALVTLALAVPALAIGCVLAVVATTATSLVVGSRGAGRAHRGPLRALAVAVCLYAVAEIVRGVLTGQMGPVSLLAQAFELPAFALLIGAPVAMARAARAQENRPQRIDTAAILDGALLATGATACTLALLTIPAALDPRPRSWDGWVMLAYPVLDVVFVLAVAYLALVSRPGLVARRLMLTSAFALFLGDIAQAWNRAHGGGHAWASAPYVLGLGLLGAVALHPSVADLGHGTPRQSYAWSPARVAILGLGLLSPALLMLFNPNHGDPYRITNAITVMVGTLIVLTRAVWAVNQSARTEDALRLQAERDPLTGLANRAAFLDRVQNLLADARGTATVSVLFIDLDGFKTVNDTRGHATGDLLLQAVAQRLREALRSNDFAARLGGDEFAIVTADDAQGAVGERVADRVQHLFDSPFQIGHLTLPVSASVGMANTAQMPRPDGSVLIGAADAAMYQAKRAGSASWQRAGAAVNAHGDAAAAWQDLSPVTGDRRG